MFLIAASWLPNVHGKETWNVMKINMLTKRVIGVVFGLSLLLGIGIASSSEAQAQWRDPQWARQQQRDLRGYPARSRFDTREPDFCRRNVQRPAAHIRHTG